MPPPPQQEVRSEGQAFTGQARSQGRPCTVWYIWVGNEKRRGMCFYLGKASSALKMLPQISGRSWERAPLKPTDGSTPCVNSQQWRTFSIVCKVLFPVVYLFIYCSDSVMTLESFTALWNCSFNSGVAQRHDSWVQRILIKSIWQTGVRILWVCPGFVFYILQGPSESFLSCRVLIWRTINLHYKVIE